MYLPRALSRPNAPTIEPNEMMSMRELNRPSSSFVRILAKNMKSPAPKSALSALWAVMSLVPLAATRTSSELILVPS